MSVASYLLYAVAVIQVINAILTFSISSDLSAAVRDAYAGTEAEGADSIVSIAFIGGAVINLLLGVGFAVLGYFDSRGKNAARIVTWVIGGISLCCLGINLGGTALVGGVNGGSTTSGAPSSDEVERRINEAMPSWFTPATTTLAAVGLIAILAAVILLALPASNDFFRKPAAAGAWDPSMPYPGPYSGQQPPYPGQQPPYPGQQPPYPGQQQPPYPSYGPGTQGQPGQPAPGLPPYPGSTPPASNPFAPPGSTPPPGSQPPPSSGEQPPRPPTDPA
ncbi:hypothetical protein KOI35_41840 [Actinoplanes bogorensis]|uniref:Uncharacterized protein n=1 Tax=Paractinoplanes bogorensis TaxID=1610840 RepID=A0ABS5Z538_9ACTN|nr:hypothetical protein [Actinoplanes bogorensis]